MLIRSTVFGPDVSLQSLTVVNLLFCGSSDSWRNVRAQGAVAAQIVAKLRQRSEFSVLVTFKQDTLNSGVLLSIHNGVQK